MRANESMDTVEIDRVTLKTLVASLEAFWDDHRFAQNRDNPGWVSDHEALRTARTALGKR